MMHEAFVQLVSTQGEAGDKLRLRTWIEVQLVGEDGKPIAGETCAIMLPGGRIVTRTTGQDGVVRLEGIAPGTCRISFPRLDHDLWTPVETQSSSDGRAA